MRLLNRTAICGPAASRWAMAIAASCSSSPGTTWFTSPMRSASTAGEQVAGEQVLLRPVHADEHRPEHRAAVAGDDARLHVRVADPRALGHEHDVAEERERGAESDRVAVDRGDHRLTHREDRPRHPRRIRSIRPG